MLIKCQLYLVFLQLQMTDNVGNLLALFVRKLPLDLNWDLAAALGDHSAAPGGSRNLLTCDNVTCDDVTIIVSKIVRPGVR